MNFQLFLEYVRIKLCSCSKKLNKFKKKGRRWEFHLALRLQISMSHVDNKLLKQKDKDSNLIIYVRYVDDFFAVFDSQN